MYLPQKGLGIDVRQAFKKVLEEPIENRANALEYIARDLLEQFKQAKWVGDKIKIAELLLGYAFGKPKRMADETSEEDTKRVIRFIAESVTSSMQTSQTQIEDE